MKLKFFPWRLQLIGYEEKAHIPNQMLRNLRADERVKFAKDAIALACLNLCSPGQNPEKSQVDKFPRGGCRNDVDDGMNSVCHNHLLF